ncbi:MULTISPECIES: hypothetical protein [Stenotrophomonas]|uniref:Uncharacterized protein n=1 Tax=Stenotrophomonas nitritireducens TaxID=83617 RepID=A0A9D8KWJ8_9GAMM|nr:MULTISPECIES: hypothetical protein [Stenotrophomonas]KQO00444.1 hypothetical protein ASF01_05720 [Stenotrophomonas sp. Leaf70]MBN8791830.1 hypothetical protein [Stenotrophomonas nitritireducens]MBN8795766.1 hypothetical protein [Stenotrophomonas nitritireducens]MBN8798113.1 hypothetical protein [Stenotrophomonas nitritireducens]
MKAASRCVLVVLAGVAGLAAVQIRQAWPSPLGNTVSGLLIAVSGVLIALAVADGIRPRAEDCAPLAVRQRYMRRFFAAMGGYLLAVFASVWMLRYVESLPLRVLLALLPVPPVALVIGAMVRYVREVDEMQQRIELQAVSIATALVSLLYLTGGFLQSAKVVDLRASTVMLMVFPLVCAVYGLAKFVVARRYR